MFRYLLIFAFSLISACSPKEPVKISPQISVPAKFSLYSGKPDYSVKWWKSFGDSELDLLIESALKNNFSIAELLAGLGQKRAEASKKGAEKLPSLNLESEKSYELEKEKGVSEKSDNNLSIGLSLSYEIDLWDRLKAGKKEAELNFKASQEDFNAFVLILSAEVAGSFADLISISKQIRFLEQQLSYNRKFLRLIEIRFRNAASTTLDLYQQRKVIEQINSSLIDLKTEKKLLENHIALLTGKTFERSFVDEGKSFPKVKKIPEVGVPADILSARPDVRAAGLRLRSAGWAVAAAKADRLPKLSFSASYTHSTEKLKDIFDNWILNLTANIAGPIFDGGYGKAEVERTKYLVDERIATYRKTVFTAIREVEDALLMERRSYSFLSSVNRRIKIAEEIVAKTEYRYLKGVGDFFPVIREKLVLLELLKKRIQTEAELFKARIVLYKSLGGTWMKNYGKSPRI